MQVYIFDIFAIVCIRIDNAHAIFKYAGHFRSKNSNNVNFQSKTMR